MKTKLTEKDIRRQRWNKKKNNKFKYYNKVQWDEENKKIIFSS